MHRKPGNFEHNVHYFHKYLHNDHNDELNSRFIWGLLSTMYKSNTLCHNTQLYSWLLHSERFSVEYCPKSPRACFWGDLNIYGFPKCCPKIQNDIVFDLFWTRWKVLTQAAIFIIKPLFPPIPESLTSSKLTGVRSLSFKRIHESIKDNIIQANYNKLIMSIMMPQKNLRRHSFFFKGGKRLWKKKKRFWMSKVTPVSKVDPGYR